MDAAETAPRSDQDRPVRFCIVQDHTPEAAAIYFSRMAIDFGLANHGGLDENGEIILEPVVEVVEVPSGECANCGSKRKVRQQLTRLFSLFQR